MKAISIWQEHITLPPNSKLGGLVEKRVRGRKYNDEIRLKVIYIHLVVFSQLM